MIKNSPYGEFFAVALRSEIYIDKCCYKGYSSLLPEKLALFEKVEHLGVLGSCAAVICNFVVFGDLIESCSCGIYTYCL